MNTVLPRDQWIAAMPRVVMTAGMMFTDAEGRVLLVDKAYREDGIWSWPGGGADANEVAEELGLGVEPGAMLTGNWSHATEDQLSVRRGHAQRRAEAAIVFDDELRGFAFFDPEKAATLLSEASRGEFAAALIAKVHGTGVDLVDGGPCPGAATGGGR